MVTDNSLEPDPRFVPGRMLSDLRAGTQKPEVMAEVCGGRLRAVTDGSSRYPLANLWCPLSDRWRPSPGRYIVACDASRGGGAISVLHSKDGGKKVLSFRSGCMPAKEQADVAIELCKAFADSHGKPAFLIWNANSYGVIFGDQIVDRHFDRYYRRDNGKGGCDASRRSELLRPYCEALGVGLLCNPDRYAIDALGDYEMGKDGEPAYVAHNDGSSVVIADALAWFAYMSKQFTCETTSCDTSTTRDTKPAHHMRRVLRWMLFMCRNRFRLPTYPDVDDFAEPPKKLHIGPWGRTEWVSTAATRDMQRSADNYYGITEEDHNGDS